MGDKSEGDSEGKMKRSIYKMTGDTIKPDENKKHTKQVEIISSIMAVLFCAAAVAVDQFTKYLAVTHLKDHDSIVLIPGVFELHYLENRGAAFGMFQNMQFFFMIGAIVIVLVVWYLYVKMPHTPRYYPLRICAVLLCAGAIGNMIDRARLNYVVDFFYFSLIDFPIFNVADCYVVGSCILFACVILFYYKDENDFSWISRERKQKEYGK